MSGFRQGLAFALATLALHGIGRVALEDPGPREHDVIARRAGLSAVPVPVDDHGLDVGRLRETGARAVLLTPAGSTATCDVCGRSTALGLGVRVNGLDQYRFAGAEGEPSGRMGGMVLRYAAFTTDPAGGNPAGVVLDAAGLDDAEMQRIAADVGYSESAFLTPAGNHYRARYFSPLAEVPFCGHATIATAVALAERDGVGDLVFETQAGTIPVHTAKAGTVVASLTSVPTRSEPLTEGLDRILAALRWSPDDLDPDWPPHIAFGGALHPVLAARTRDRLATLDYDFDALQHLSREHNWATLQLFWPQDDHTVHARDPFPIGGVVEDPATGAAAAAFGGYLRALGRVPRGRLTIRQGEDMGRPSELIVDVDPDDPRVTVTGAAVPIPH